MFVVENIKEFPDLTNQEYHSHGLEVISSSFVKTVAKHSVGKALQPTEYNNALAFGTLFHDFMEHGQLPDNYVVAPDLDKRTKEYKAWVAENEFNSIVSRDDYEKVQQMNLSVINNDFVKDLFLSYEPFKEYSYFGDFNSLSFRIRPDVHFRDAAGNIVAICDYKTCQDVTQFKWDIKKYGYDVQAVFYSDFLGVDPSQFYFIAVEKTAPYTTQVFSLSESTIGYARSTMLRAIDRIKEWKIYGDTRPDFGLIEVV